MSRRVARSSWSIDGGLDRGGKGRVGGHQDGRRIGSVLGLGDEVGRDASGIGRRRGEDHPLGRPGREVDTDLAADLDLGGGDPRVARPDDPVDRREAGVGQAERERPDRLGATGNDEGVDLEQPGRPEEDGIRPAIAVGGRRDDDLTHARDAGRHDGHDQRGWVGCRATGDIGADPVERRPAPLDFDARRDRGPGRRRPLGLGEAPDVVDGLLERAADGRVEAVARIAQLRGIEDEAAVRAAAAHGRVGVADGVVAARTDVVEGRARGLPDPRVGDGAATDERRVRDPGDGVAGGDGGQVEPSQPERRAVRAGRVGGIGRGRQWRRRHGTIFSMGRTRMPDAPAALSRGGAPTRHRRRPPNGSRSCRHARAG